MTQASNLVLLVGYVTLEDFNFNKDHQYFQ